jgi:hypothetical protein
MPSFVGIGTITTIQIYYEQTPVYHHYPPRFVKFNNLKTIRSMFPKTSPETSGAIRARLTDLRNRKAALDEAIASLERYAVYAMPRGAAIPRKAPKVVQMKSDARLAGAA